MGHYLDNQSLPGRGETMSGTFGDTANPTTSDILITDYAEYEGLEKWFDDVDWGAASAVNPPRSTRKVLCRLVRNTAQTLIHAKRLAVLGIDGDSNGQTAVAGPNGTTRVIGYGRLTDAKCFAVDEFLPARGVKINDLFWLVMDGPAKVLADLANNVAHIQQGMLLFGAHTAAAALATSSATSAGRVNDGVLLSALQATGATTGEAVYHSQLLLGQAMSSIASTWTGTDVLVDITGGRF